MEKNYEVIRLEQKQKQLNDALNTLNEYSLYLLMEHDDENSAILERAANVLYGELYLVEKDLESWKV